jgi:hypothetical protein
MKKKKVNKNVLQEADGIKIARLFYAQTQLVSDSIIKDDTVCETLKKTIFVSNMRNFDDIPLEEQESYIIAANAGWTAGMSVLRMLIEINEDKKNDNKGDK